MKEKIAVIGGGISGLVTAVILKRMGRDVRVFESSDRAGGVISTKKIEGYLVEEGPHTLVIHYPELLKFLEHMNLTDQLVRADEVAQKRYILKWGKLYPLPHTPFSFLKTPLLSFKGKLRFFREVFQSLRNNDEETVEEFFTRRFGREFLEYFIEPFISGIFAGDVGRLELCSVFPQLKLWERRYGNVCKGVLFSKIRGENRKTNGWKGGIYSFRNGLEELVDNLVSCLGTDLKLNTSVVAVEPSGQHKEIRVRTSRGEEVFPEVILSVPAYQLTKMLDEKVLGKEIKTPEYAPIATINLGFSKNSIAHPLDGFGFLVPRNEKRQLLGTLFMSSLFPERAPAGKVLLSCFVGGGRNPEALLEPDEKLTENTVKELQEVLGVRGEPELVHIRRWEKGIVQFSIGHQKFLRHLEQIESRYPGLSLTGSYREKASLAGIMDRSLRLLGQKG